MKVISVLSNKGGVGKTTTSVHLARYLHEHGGVTLLDGDLNASALAWSKLGDGLGFEVYPVEQSAQLSSEYVVIDVAARPTPAELAALDRKSHLTVIPVIPDALSLMATLKMLKPRPLRNYRILFTMVPNQGSILEYTQACEKEGHPVMVARMHYRQAYRNATELGRTVDRLGRPGRPAWLDVVSLGEEVAHALR